MATFEQEQAKHKELQTVLAELNTIQPNSLIRAEELGKELSFESGLPVFERTLGLFRDLSENKLDNVPFEILEQLRGQAAEALSFFKQIQNFSVQQHTSNPAGVRDSFIQQVRDHWYQYYAAITPHIAYAIRRGTDFDALEREARGTLALQKELATELAAEKEKILAEMQGALERVRRAASEAGVAQHAIHFKTEAEFHKRQSRYWLVGTLAFGLVTIVYALYSLGPQLNDLTATNIPRAIQLIVPRLVVIFVLTFGLVWSARNFAASRHNFVVNRHRQNALSSFETFVKGTSGDDSQTKNAVLLQATQSIFLPQDSGFAKGDVAPQLGGQIVEIVRGTSERKA